MIQPEERAVNLFNEALKDLIIRDIELKKQIAKESALQRLNSIKEALYDVTQYDDFIPRKTIAYFQKVREALEKI